MTDKNGITLRTGQIVKIEGGYFKADNGTFRIVHAPGNENWLGKDFCLYKVNKKNEDSKTKYKTAFWPLSATTNSFSTRMLAREHNAKNATIEVIGSITVYKIKTVGDHWNRETVHILFVTESELLAFKQEPRTSVEILEVYN